MSSPNVLGTLKKGRGQIMLVVGLALWAKQLRGCLLVSTRGRKSTIGRGLNCCIDCGGEEEVVNYLHLLLPCCCQVLE